MSLSITPSAASLAIRQLTAAHANSSEVPPKARIDRPIVEPDEISQPPRAASINPLEISRAASRETSSERDIEIRQPVVIIDRDSGTYSPTIAQATDRATESQRPAVNVQQANENVFRHGDAISL